MYVVVSGLPASGKSTLALDLARELGWPLLAKDRIKEVLASVLPPADVAASRLIGRAAVAVLLDVARECGDCALDSVWHRPHALDELATVVPSGESIVELFCRCDRPTLEARYLARAPSRGEEHVDLDRTPDELWGPDTSRPVGGDWPVIEVDTMTATDIGKLVHLINGVASQ